MQRRPHVNRALATRMAARTDGELPELSRPEALAAVASIRLAALRAGPLAVTYSALAGVPASRIAVIDRRTWALAALRMIDEVLEPLPMTARPAGLRRAVVGAGYGTAGGLALGFVGRHLLGQFDAFSADPCLLLLAPNIVEHERRHGLDAEDFRLWVAVHEQTHAVQLSAAPWLREHLLDRLARIVVDEPGVRDMLEGLSLGRGLQGVMASSAGRAALDEITATMTLLEGHADFVADTAGADHVPSVRRLRGLFSRAGGPNRLGRLLPTMDKGSQYRDGLAFCRRVAARAGRAGLAEAFSSPGNLPTPAEIAEPESWVRRVHGQA